MSAYLLGNAPNLYNADGSPAGQMGLDGVEYPSPVSGAGVLVGTGNDDSALIAQFINDMNASGKLPQLAGDFIAASPMTWRSTRLTGNTNKGIGLTVQGIPGARIYSPVSAATPLISINSPATAGVGRRQYMIDIGGFQLLRTTSGTTQAASGTNSGIGIYIAPLDAAGDVSQCLNLHDMFIDGWDYPLTLSDCSGSNLERLWFHSFKTAVRIGYNVDILKVKQCFFGSEQFNQYTGVIAFQTGFADGFNTAGSENCIEFDHVWAMGLEKFMEVQDQNQGPLKFNNVYLERVARYLHAKVGSTAYTVQAVFDSCQFSQMDVNDVTQMDPLVAGYGAKIHLDGDPAASTGAAAAGPTPNITIRNSRGAGTPNNALVSFCNRGVAMRVNYDGGNNIPASATYGHVRSSKSNYTSWAVIPDNATGRASFGDGNGGGVVMTSGDERPVSATISAAATYDIHPQKGDLFILTLPDGDCTLRIQQFVGTGSQNAAMTMKSKVRLILIVPAAVGATRTITFHTSIKGCGATLTYASADVNKRAVIELRGRTDTTQEAANVGQLPYFA